MNQKSSNNSIYNFSYKLLQIGRLLGDVDQDKNLVSNEDQFLGTNPSAWIYYCCNNFGHVAPGKWVGIAMLCCSALHNTTQHRYCKILQQKNSNAWKQSNQSHLPSSIWLTSQRGCHFTLAERGGVTYENRITYMDSCPATDPAT